MAGFSDCTHWFLIRTTSGTIEKVLNPSRLQQTLGDDCRVAEVGKQMIRLVSLKFGE